jgi:hypothetical protein
MLKFLEIRLANSNCLRNSLGLTLFDESNANKISDTPCRSVARSHATQVAIIITASPTSALHRTKKQAHEARKAGLTLIPIGIGDVNIEELRAIAGTADDSMQYILGSKSKYCLARKQNIVS